MNYIDKLTELQKHVGYVKGNPNPVALLGLFGETGEVMEASMLSHLLNDWEAGIHLVNGIRIAQKLDEAKKYFRDHPEDRPGSTDEFPEIDFDVELSDVFYYLNALCINRGMTIDQLAQISYEKVSKRVQVDILNGIKRPA